ncbi:MAG: endopeptidase La [Cytophagales bacterium]|jgi:ATP-dependent Lon protease|nr:endopeptidase La [Cytophagales bacterium]
MSESSIFGDIIFSIDFLKFLLSNNPFDEVQDEKEEEIIKDLPLFIEDAVLFPNVFMTLAVDKGPDVNLLKNFEENSDAFGVILCKSNKELYTVGTIANVLKYFKLQGSNQVLLKGTKKFEIISVRKDESGKTFADVKILKEPKVDVNSASYTAMGQAIKDVTSRLCNLSHSMPNEVKIILTKDNNLSFYTYLLASGLNIDLTTKQKILEAKDCVKRASLILKFLTKEVEIAELKKKIQDKVQGSINQSQKEFYIKQQINSLKEEIGESFEDNEIELLRKKGEKKKWSNAANEFFLRNLSKAEKLSPNSSDYSILLNHCELMLDLPWDIYSHESLGLKKAEKILEEDHYGMEKIKERILEHLAILQLKKDPLKGQILCLFGAPGVGKTSLCKSIAKALNRKCVKVSLGGIQDEAEIRGHRKTYVGAMPGKIIKGINTAKTSNPVFVLDEIDKMGSSHGDPAAALLEVLDPEQNNKFVDHFLETPYDLSKVMFVATANRLDSIPAPLLDRVEVWEVNGYTVEEKINIAKKYLIPNQIKEHGLKTKQVCLSDKAIVKVVEHYTRESGVRELNRQLATLMRKIVVKVVRGEQCDKNITDKDIEKFLGIEKFDKDLCQKIKIPGIAIGLAWTPVGGDILFVETTSSIGTSKFTMSGKLGEVMKESALIAFTYLKAHYADFMIDKEIFNFLDVHIHIPDGATPKDGPSAGITLFTALTSLFTQRKVKDNLAMTGEISLRGKILPVGGIKEKILAAKRAGVKTILMCKENQKEIAEIKKEYIEDVDFHFFSEIKDVLAFALEEEVCEEHIDFQKIILEQKGKTKLANL